MDVKQIIIFALIVVSAFVAGGLAAKKNMWRWIVLYWIILTIKNFVDFVWGG